MNHSQFQDRINAALKQGGYKVYHTYDSRRSESGFPDTLAIRKGDGRFVVVELKIKGPNVVAGRPTPAQAEWLDLFAGAEKPEVYVWRPEDWDEIVSIV